MHLLTSALLTAALITAPASAQRKDNQEKTLQCRDDNNGGRQMHHCEIKEIPLPATGLLDADASPNGGVTVKGWSRSDVLVRVKIEAQADTDTQARDLVSRVQVDTSASRIRATGPTSDRNSNWSVSYEIFTPFRTDVTVRTVNGGLRLADLSGRIDCQAVNGGLHLARLSGNVKATTTNGGVNVELDGQRWEGEGLDVKTNNGGVKVEMPQSYSARLDTGTVNGNLDLGVSTVVQGKISKEMMMDVGGGGAVLRVRTTNGSVHITKKS